MGFVDIAILIGIAAIVAGAYFVRYKRRKAGKGCCNCEGCSKCGK